MKKALNLLGVGDRFLYSCLVRTVYSLNVLLSVPFGMLAEGLVFAIKALLILLALSVVSVLYARLRIDQLASLGWRVLAPLALLQTLVVIWIGVE